MFIYLWSFIFEEPVPEFVWGTGFQVTSGQVRIWNLLT
jgi:hypothetical protein